jgi:hypothetical protein
VLGQPRLDALLQARAGVAELRELDEVLELEVVDVVDQGARDGRPLSGPLPSFTERVPTPRAQPLEVVHERALASLDESGHAAMLPGAVVPEPRCPGRDSNPHAPKGNGF